MKDAAAFIRAHLRLEGVAGLPGIRLYTAHPGSRLSQLATEDAPYWAYSWAGGLALTHHLRAEPHLVRGKRVLDLGAGSGLVAIAVAQAGATTFAAEIDPHGQAAISLNAEANGVTVQLIPVDLAGPSPTNIDLITAGDVFYNAEIAAVMLPFLERCAAAGVSVLIGDPARRDLPLERLREIASYSVRDVGDKRTATEWIGRVYGLRTAP